MYLAVLLCVAATGKKLFCRACSGSWDGVAGQLLLLSVFTGCPSEVTSFTNTSGRLHQPFLVGRRCLSKTDCAPMKIWPISIAAFCDLGSV